MLQSAIEKTGPLAAVSKLLDGTVHLCTSLAADRQGSTAIEYALTLGAIVRGGSGITSAIGIEIGNLFGVSSSTSRCTTSAFTLQRRSVMNQGDFPDVPSHPLDGPIPTD